MKHDPEDPERKGRYAYEGLTRIVHEKARLGILTSLAANPRGLFFTDLKELCSLTDGNLSRHLQALEEAGLVLLLRGTSGRRPQTLVRMTTEGRERYQEYVTELERVIRDAARVGDENRDRKIPFPEGWSPA